MGLVQLRIFGLCLGKLVLAQPGLAPRPEPLPASTLDGLEGVRELRYRIYDQDVLRFRPGTRMRVRDFSGYEEWTIGEDGLVARSLGHFDENEYRHQLEYGAARP